MADVLGDAVKVYKKLLQESPQAMAYLRGRGLSARAINHFDLGATHSIGKFYYNMHMEYKYTDEQLEAEGLIMTNGETRETFMKSVIIPTKDIEGRVVNITQRRLDNHPVKYLNLPHRPLAGFFGIEMLANRHMYDQLDVGFVSPVMICEGQMDTMLAQQEGIPALGIPGVNSMREVMFDNLKWFKSVIFCFDNDLPGRSATKKMASYVKHYYPNTKLFEVALPEQFNDLGKYVEDGRSMGDLSIRPLDSVKPLSFKKPKPRKNSSTDEKLLKVKEISIKEFIESITKGTQWTKRNNVLKTKCPLPKHKDTVDSFTIYTETNTYFCFGCGCGGDAVDFCCNMFGTNFKTAVNILSKWKDAR